MCTIIYNYTRKNLRTYKRTCTDWHVSMQKFVCMLYKFARFCTQSAPTHAQVCNTHFFMHNRTHSGVTTCMNVYANLRKILVVHANSVLIWALVTQAQG